MLTVLDCINGVRNAKIETLKGKILREFYGQILSDASIFRTSGTIEFTDDVSELLVEAYDGLLEYKYDLKKYTKIDHRYLQDGEFVLNYNLEGFDSE